jgi:hypothetical protein
MVNGNLALKDPRSSVGIATMVSKVTRRGRRLRVIVLLRMCGSSMLVHAEAHTRTAELG